MGIDLTIRDDDLLPKPRAIRDFKVEIIPNVDWFDENIVGVKAVALVAIDDTGTVFVRRKIACRATKEFVEDGEPESLTERIREILSRCDHENMEQKARQASE